MESDPDFSWRPLDASSGSTPAVPGPASTPPPMPPAASSAGESRPSAEQKLAPEQARGAVALAEPPLPPGDYGEFDVDDVPPPKGRGPASIRYLGIAIMVAAGFWGGVWEQKHHDAGYSPPAKGLAALAGAGGGGGAGAGRGAGAAGAGAAAAAAAAAGAGAPGGAGGGGGGGRAPVLLGTVVKVSGSDVTVRDANGTEHVVHTSETTKVARTEALTDLAAGSTVSVSGTANPSGDIAATQIVEKPGGTPTAPPAGAAGNAAAAGGNASGTTATGGAPGGTGTAAGTSSLPGASSGSATGSGHPDGTSSTTTNGAAPGKS
jgi:hypothetical protein